MLATIAVIVVCGVRIQRYAKQNLMAQRAKTIQLNQQLTRVLWIQASSSVAFTLVVSFYIL